MTENVWRVQAAEIIPEGASQMLARLIVVGAAIFVTGCDAAIDSFAVNRIYAKRLEMGEDVDLSQVSLEVHRIVQDLFGTPDEPTWPEFLEAETPGLEIVSLERLQRAAGAVRSDERGIHFGLYREHCILCHGTAGSGLGPTSRLLNPYPRDFRPGKFKFKSTPLGIKPTQQDLLAILGHGIAGTSMPSFRLLEEEDLQALVDYVIYLSVRGEVERRLLTYATFELDWEEDGTIDLKPEELGQDIRDIVRGVVAAWAEAPQASLADIRPPAELPLVGGDVYLEPVDPRLAESIVHGRELFHGNIANCASCHGPQATGGRVPTDFDDWTKEWTTAIGLDPLDKASLRPMLDLGALKPRPIAPRNLRLGSFRGGSRPEDLYLRIVHGIEGTPMPAVPLKPENSFGLSQADVWDIVNYLLSLSADDLPRLQSPDAEKLQSRIGES